MTASLEVHAKKFWSLMLQMKRGEYPVTQEYARSIELPTLALSTPFPKLAERIQRELGQPTVKELSNDQ